MDEISMSWIKGQNSVTKYFINKELPFFQKIVTYYHPPIFAETPAPLANGLWTRLFF